MAARRLCSRLAAGALAFCSITSPAVFAQPPNGAVALAHARYEAARTAFEHRVEHCLRQQARTVNMSAFDGLGLTRRQMEVSAFVLSQRAMRACEAPLAGELALAIGTYRAVALHHRRPVPPQVEHDEAALVGQAWKQLDKEASEYASLSDPQRRQLESRAELQTPFDFTGVLTRLRTQP